MATRYHWMADTSEAAFDKLIELQRGLTPGEKVLQALQLAAITIHLSASSVRKLYPSASEREVFLRAAARRLDPDTMSRVYGRDSLSAKL
jgi:hypothetical protein